MRGELIKEKRIFGIYYLSKLRHNSISTDFQLARKLTNYISAAPLELRLSGFRNVS